MFDRYDSTTRGTDGTPDPGYSGLYWVGGIILIVIPWAFILLTIKFVLDPTHSLDLVGVAALITSAGACFGTAAAGVGLFRAGDRDRPGVVTSHTETIVTPVPPAPAVVEEAH
jgi:hypothetical protein